MIRGLSITMLALLAGLFVSGMAAAKEISLHGPHAVTIEHDDPAFADPSYDDSAWPRIKVPSSLRAAGLAGRPDVFWYRITFELPDDWHSETPALRLGIISRSDETYLNGVLIGGRDIVGPAHSDWHAYATIQPRLYAFEPSLLRPGQRNVVAIRGAREPYIDDGGLISGPVALVELQSVLPEYTTLLTRFVTLNSILSGIETLIVIILIGCIFAGVRSRLLLLYQLLFLPSYFFFLEHRGILAMLGFDSQLLQFVANISGALALPLLLEIVAHIFNRPVGYLGRSFQILSIVALASLPNTDIPLLDWWAIESNLVWHALMLFALCVACFWTVQASLQRKPFSTAMLIGMVLLTLTLVIDLAFPLNYFEQRIGLRLAGFGMLGLFLSLAFVVLQSFVDREHRLLAANEDISDLHEQERARMASEVHDGIGQWLGAIKVKLDLLRTQASDAGSGVTGVDDLAADVERVIDDTRRLAHDLSPGLLAEYGLIGAMQATARHLQSVVRIDFAIMEPVEVALGGADQMHVYRIFQEAIGNALKHSGAKLINVSVQQAGGAFRLEIQDNGTWNRRKVLERDVTGSDSLGLRSMFNRARVLGGGLAIHPSEKSGTTISLTVPTGGFADA